MLNEGWVAQLGPGARGRRKRKAEEGRRALPWLCRAVSVPHGQFLPELLLSRGWNIRNTRGQLIEAASKEVVGSNVSSAKGRFDLKERVPHIHFQSSWVHQGRKGSFVFSLTVSHQLMTSHFRCPHPLLCLEQNEQNNPTCNRGGVCKLQSCSASPYKPWWGGSYCLYQILFCWDSVELFQPSSVAEGMRDELGWMHSLSSGITTLHLLGSQCPQHGRNVWELFLG